MRLLLHLCPAQAYCCRFQLRSQARPSKETIGGSAITFRALRNWVLSHKLSEASEIDLDQYLERARERCPECTVQDAINRIKNVAQAEFTIGEAATTGRADWDSQISKNIDWNALAYEEQQRGELISQAEAIKAAYQAGVIKPSELGLYQRPNPPSPKLTSKAREALESQIRKSEERAAKLELELKEALSKAKTPEDVKTQLKIADINGYIQARAKEENLSPADAMLLSSLIVESEPRDRIIRRIEDEIFALKSSRRAPAAPSAIGGLPSGERPLEREIEKFRLRIRDRDGNIVGREDFDTYDEALKKSEDLAKLREQGIYDKNTQFEIERVKVKIGPAEIKPIVPVFQVLDVLKKKYLNQEQMTADELTTLITGLINLDLADECDAECQEILSDYFAEQERLRKGEMRLEQQRFAVEEQHLQYSARVEYQGKVISDNAFSSETKAQEKAAQIEKLIAKGVFLPGTTVRVVNLSEEARRGLE